MKTFLSIDPGKSGGYLIKEPRECLDSCIAEPMPETFGDFVEEIRFLAGTCKLEGWELVCYCEQVPCFVGRNIPGASAFKLGEHFGAIQGVLLALNIRTILVTPQRWQKHFGLGTRSACKSDSQWKQKLKAEAQRRFPTLKLTNKTADAALILDYALRIEGQSK